MPRQKRLTEEMRGKNSRDRVRATTPPPFWCLCLWIEGFTGVPYTCEPETRNRCLDRAKRGASSIAPSAVPPLSNRGVS